MKTHTIKNKNNNPIVSFSKKFIDLMNEHNTWTKQVIVHGLLQDLFSLTCRTHTLSYETETLLNFEIGQIDHNDEPVEYTYIRKWFIDGRRGLDCSLEQQLKIVGTLSKLLEIK